MPQPTRPTPARTVNNDTVDHPERVPNPPAVGNDGSPAQRTQGGAPLPPDKIVPKKEGEIDTAPIATGVPDAKNIDVKGREQAPSAADVRPALVERTPGVDRSFGVNDPQTEATDRSVSRQAAQAGDAHAKAVATLITEAPQAERRQADLDGEEEGEEACFSSGEHSDLTQFLPSGGMVQFRWGRYTTKNQAEIEGLRALAEGKVPGVSSIITEEEVEKVLECPYCDFTDIKYSALKRHVREEHPGKKVPSHASLLS